MQNNIDYDITRISQLSLFLLYTIKISCDILKFFLVFVIEKYVVLFCVGARTPFFIVLPASLRILFVGIIFTKAVISIKRSSEGSSVVFQINIIFVKYIPLSLSQQDYHTTLWMSFCPRCITFFLCACNSWMHIIFT